MTQEQYDNLADVLGKAWYEQGVWRETHSRKALPNGGRLDVETIFALVEALYVADPGFDSKRFQASISRRSYERRVKQASKTKA